LAEKCNRQKNADKIIALARKADAQAKIDTKEFRTDVSSVPGMSGKIADLKAAEREL
jgi:hypothetical protein